MRQVYDFAITPDGAALPGANGASVIFRFMPDAKEVHSALEVCDLQDRDAQARKISVARCYPMKNRSPDVLPFDYNRLVLKEVDFLLCIYCAAHNSACCSTPCGDIFHVDSLNWFCIFRKLYTYY